MVKKLFISLLFVTHSCFSLEIFAHRGSSALAPENTLYSIEMALQTGVHGVEFDVQLTSDGEIVVLHDDTLERVAFNFFNLLHEEYHRIITTPIEKLSYPEIQLIDVGAWKGKAFGKIFVPTLSELLDLIPSDKVAVIDIKGSQALLPPLIEIVSKASCKIILVSFSLNLIQEAKALLPQVSCYYTLLQEDISESFQKEKALEDATLLNGLSLEAGPLITEDLAHEIHLRGQKLMTWVRAHPFELDTLETARQYESKGVDYFITNQPELMFLP